MTISIEERDFLIAEPVIVDVELTNVGETMVKTTEPNVKAFSVRFSFTGPLDAPADERDEYSFFGVGFGAPAWRSGEIELQPGGSFRISAEHFTGMEGPGWHALHLPVGRYSLRARYHPQVYESPEHLTDFIESNTLEFVIVGPQGEEKEVFESLQEYMWIDHLHHKDTNRRREFLNGVLERWPNSAYRVSVLEALTTVEFHAKDWEALDRAYARLREEDGISIMKRDVVKSVQADNLMRNLDRLPEAIRVLEGAKMQQVVWQRNGYISDWKRRHPDSSLTFLDSQAPEAVAATDPAGSRQSRPVLPSRAVDFVALGSCSRLRSPDAGCDLRSRCNSPTRTGRHPQMTKSRRAGCAGRSRARARFYEKG
ncbi:MAG: hypothetical protein WED34_12640 [Planctomycetales bacterium]